MSEFYDEVMIKIKEGIKYGAVSNIPSLLSREPWFEDFVDWVGTVHNSNMYQEAYQEGAEEGYNSGYADAEYHLNNKYDEGYEEGQEDGYKSGYDEGYEEGKKYAEAQLNEGAIH